RRGSTHLADRGVRCQSRRRRSRRPSIRTGASGHGQSKRRSYIPGHQLTPPERGGEENGSWQWELVSLGDSGPLGGVPGHSRVAICPAYARRSNVGGALRALPIVPPKREIQVRLLAGAFMPTNCAV